MPTLPKLLTDFWLTSILPPDFLKFFFLFFRAALTAHGRSRLGVKLERQLLACATATAMWDLGRVCDLYHSLWQQILNPLSEAILMDTSQVHYR